MSNIILIGMPGSGKSTCGVLAAKALGMAFTDTDIRLQQALGTLLQAYIEKHGIEDFLDREAEVIRALEVHNHVVATGGSVVLRPEALAHLRENAAAVVYLRLPVEEIERRISDITTRGIAMRPGETIADIFRAREPLYIASATHTLDCAGQGVEQTVRALRACLDRL